MHASPQENKSKSLNSVFKICQKDCYPDINHTDYKSSIVDGNSADIKAIRHVEPVQNLSDTSQSDESLLHRSRHDSDKVYPLQYVEDVTSLQHVQASYTDFQEHVSSKVAAAFRQSPMLEKTSSISSHDSDLTQQEQQVKGYSVVYSADILWRV